MKMATLMAAAFAALASFGAGITVTPVKPANVVTGVNLTFSDLGASTYRLFVAYGEKDGGNISHRDWEKFAYVTDVTAATDGYAYSTMPDGWGTRYHAMRFFLIDAAAAKPFDKQVDYIQGDGTGAYIETGWRPNGLSVVDVEFSDWVSTSGTGIMSARGGAAPFFNFFVQNSGLSLRYDYSGYGPGDTQLYCALDYSTRHVWRADRFGVMKDGERVATFKEPPVGGDCGASLVVFAYKTGNVLQDPRAAFKLYSLRCWDNPRLSASPTYDYVPCVKNGAPGLYDRKSGGFKPNANATGEFTVGEEVVCDVIAPSAVSDFVADFASVELSVEEIETGYRVTFPALPAAAKLVACYGKNDAGTDLKEWERTALVANLSAGATSGEFTVPADWNGKFAFLRFFLADESLKPFDKAVSYLRNPNKEYVKTDFQSYLDRMAVRLDATLTPGTSAEAWTLCCGSSTGYPPSYLLLIYTGGNFRWDYASICRQDNPVVYPTRDRHLFTSDANVNYIDGEKIYELTVSTAQLGSPIVLFAQHSGYTNWRSQAPVKIHGFRGWKNRTKQSLNLYSEVPDIDLYPCVTNGVACFWDRKGKRFLGNSSGSGALEAGEETCWVDAAQLGSVGVVVKMPEAIVKVRKTAYDADSAVSRAELTLGAHAADYSVYFAYADRDCGDKLADWPNAVYAGKALAADTNFVFTAFPSGWDKAYTCGRFFLARDGAKPYDCRIDYIQSSDSSTAAQGMKTDFIPTPYSRLEGEVTPCRNGYSAVAVSRGAGGGKPFGIWCGITDFRYDYAGNYVASHATGYNKILVAADYTGYYQNGVCLTNQTASTAKELNGYPLCILSYCNATDPATAHGTARLHWLKAWQDMRDDSSLALDLIPVRKGGEGCLYDRKNDKFYYNEKTTAYLCGATVAEDPAAANAVQAACSSVLDSHRLGLVILYR